MLMCYYVLARDTKFLLLEGGTLCVLWKLMETYLKYIEKSKGGLRIPLSIPQIHFYVGLGPT